MKYISIPVPLWKSWRTITLVKLSCLVAFVYFSLSFSIFFKIGNKRKLREFFAKNSNFALKACIGGVSKKHICYFISALKISSSAQHLFLGAFFSACFSSWALFLVEPRDFLLPYILLQRMSRISVAHFLTYWFLSFYSSGEWGKNWRYHRSYDCVKSLVVFYEKQLPQTLILLCHCYFQPLITELKLIMIVLFDMQKHSVVNVTE